MEYKYHKNLRKESLRDNMTNTELVLNMLAEVSTTAISRNENPKGLNEVNLSLNVVAMLQVMQEKI